MSYAILTRLYEEFIAWKPKTICLDECHAVKSSKAQRSRAAKLVAKEAKHIIPMSGTIFENRPMELFNSLHIVDPANWPSRQAFGYRYCDGFDATTGKYFMGASNATELKIKLRSIMLRRTKQEVLKELPPLQRIKVPVNLDLTEYHKIEREVMSAIKRLDPAHRGYFLAVIEKMSFLRKALGEMKIAPAIDLAKGFLDQTGSHVKIVIHCHHRLVATKVVEGLISYGVAKIDGATPQKKRMEINIQYQLPGGPRVLVITTAGGEGIDLFGKMGVDSSRLIMVEQHWNPMKEEQIEGRLHRLGQPNAVEAYYLVVAGSIDDDLEAIKTIKREWFRQIAGDKIESIVIKYLLGKENGE